METIDDLVADSSALIDGYLDPADREQLYNRIWHCLRWQQHDPDDRIMELIIRLYDLFVRVMPVEHRMIIYQAAKNEVEHRRFTPAVFIVFMQNEIDEGIASTATIDLLAYSKRDWSSLPVGFKALLGIVEHGMCRIPGALFGAAITFGDGDLLIGLDTMAPHMTDRHINMAARMQTGYVHHAAIQYWLSIARRMATREDQVAQSVVGSCASALVRYHQTAFQPVVTDIERLYPAWDFDPALSVKQHWSFEEYGKLIEPQLFGIREAEAGEKIFGEVIKVWCPGSDE
jgi:hypothetical protein